MTMTKIAAAAAAVTNPLERTADLWVCDDCVSWLANADLTGLDYYLSEEQAEERAEIIRQGERELIEEYGQLHVGSDTQDFSSALCDCCGALPGARHHVAAFRAPERPVTSTEDLARLTWEVADIELGDHQLSTQQVVVGLDEDGVEVMQDIYHSYIYGCCTLRAVGRPEITYLIDFIALGGDNTYADAFDFDVELNEATGNTMSIIGRDRFVDCDGDDISLEEVVQHIGNDIENGIEWELEVLKHLPTMPGPVNIDHDEDSDSMETFELERDDGPNARFSGELVAEASSRSPDGPRSQRWTELSLYKTARGTWVCQEVGRTLWVNERDRYSIYVAETDSELTEMVGYGRLAKQLYADAGVDHAEDIE